MTRGLLVVLGASVCLLACACQRFGRVGGEWVAVAGAHSSGVGIGNAPQLGGPLEVGGEECVPSALIDQALGPQCKAHEMESAGTAVYAGELEPGAHPTLLEVRWYCDRHTVIRVGLERCGETDTFKVHQIAVSTQEKDK